MGIHPHAQGRLTHIPSNLTMPDRTIDEMKETLRELEARKTALLHQIAHNEGPGAVAQGVGSAAAGAYGVAVSGDVRGDVYVGREPETDEEALRIYRRVLAATNAHLPLRGVDLGASDAADGGRRLGLAEVYVELTTKTPVPESKAERRERADSPDPYEAEKTRPLRALEAAVFNRRLVLLGDPGSGKSTFVNHLTLRLAVDGGAEGLAGWPGDEADCVPVPVVLRDFARWLPETDGPTPPRLLWEYITERLSDQNLRPAAKPLEAALDEGRAIVLLDGLDEIPSGRARSRVRDAVAAFAGRYPASRMVVTCRVLSYQDPAWRLESFPVFELAPFDDDQIDRFIGVWYADLSRVGAVRTEAEAKTQAERLKSAVRRPDLWRLAPNPLLLTVMALVHSHKGHLPEARALLYEETVDILLWRWEQIKASGQGDAPPLMKLLQAVKRGDMDLKRVLWRLAFEAHEAAGETDDDDALADIGELRLQKALAGLHPEGDRGWAQGAIETIRYRAGLLLERVPERYTFPHRTFQEYLAGAHLAAQRDFAPRAGRLAGAGAFWREVILLAVGRLFHVAGDSDKPLALVCELCPKAVRDDTPSWRKVWLAGDVLLEMGANRAEDSELGRELTSRVRRRLVMLIQKGRLTPRERVAAGEVLSRLGDPRFDPKRWYLPADKGYGFVKVPAGQFLMGSDKFEDPEATYEEIPRHSVKLPTYFIGRYPVTVAQFRAFLEDTGHQVVDAWHGYNTIDNHPVCVVSWYDAVAYCQWLTERLRPKIRQIRDLGWVIRLPSEAEWEKAARGSDGRIYPWGNEPDPQRANYLDSKIGDLSPVGCFPGGRSPFGCLDMAGNLWEWTRSLWGRDLSNPEFVYPYDSTDADREDETAGNEILRVLRAGSFGGDRHGVRCAYRSGHDPDLRNSDLGFRLACAPGKTPLEL